jgi:diacylglycerol kinase family enzyme
VSSQGWDRKRRRRLYAIAALVLTPLALLNVIGYAADDPGQVFGIALSLSIAVAIAAYGFVRRGVVRILLLFLAASFALGVIEELFDRRALDRLVLVLMLWGSFTLAFAAFRIHVPLPRAPRPRRPVLFINPRSGGGKAGRFNLADEARDREIEPIELGPDDDLADLVEDAVADGADALAMAGGDGSQAVVAAIAAERDLPYACIPAGTRNHFALDLGVDREDVVGALDAFVDGGERIVDLAEVNGRIFVNNVSLGLYATAVQEESYRAAKIRTLLSTAPDVLGPAGTPPDLRWTGPYGELHGSGRAMLISNNPYRLGSVMSSGTRPRIDDGRLGIVAVGLPVRGLRRLLPRRLWTEWSAREFEVGSAGPVPSAIDGEAVTLTAPLRFRSVPGALRVRISPRHPGASPSATRPDTIREGFRSLWAIARGHDQPPTLRSHEAEPGRV